MFKIIRNSLIFRTKVLQRHSEAAHHYFHASHPPARLILGSFRPNRPQTRSVVTSAHGANSSKEDEPPVGLINTTGFTASENLKTVCPELVFNRTGSPFTVIGPPLSSDIKFFCTQLFHFTQRFSKSIPADLNQRLLSADDENDPDNNSSNNNNNATDEAINKLLEDKGFMEALLFIAETAHLWDDFSVSSGLGSLMELQIPPGNRALNILVSEATFRLKRSGDFVSHVRLLNLMEKYIYRTSTKSTAIDKHADKTQDSDMNLTKQFNILHSSLSQHIQEQIKQMVDRDTANSETISGETDEETLETQSTPNYFLVTRPGQLMDIYSYVGSGLLSQELLPILEELTLGLLARSRTHKTQENFTYSDLCRLFVYLAHYKRRPTPIMQAATQRLLGLPYDSSQRPPALHLINAIHSLAQLRFYHHDLLNRLLFDLTQQSDFISQVKPTSLSALFSTLGQINFQCVPLIETILEKITDRTPNLMGAEPGPGNGSNGVYQLVAFVIMLARVNYVTVQCRQILIDFVMPRVSRAQVKNDLIWLEYVWSLVGVLGIDSKDHIKSVLDNEFIQRVISASTGESETTKFKNPVFVQHLYNIFGVNDLITKHPLDVHLKPTSNLLFNGEDSGPSSTSKGVELPSFQPLVRSAETVKLHNSLIETLENMIPTRKYLAKDLVSPYGFQIDAEIIMNSDGRVQSLEKFGVVGGRKNYWITPSSLEEGGMPATSGVEGQVLPSGYFRLALCTVGFRDLILHETYLGGDSALRARLMRSLGYTVVWIRQNEFPTGSQIARRCRHLQGLIKHIIMNQITHAHRSDAE